MKTLNTYKVRIHDGCSEKTLSYEIKFAEITAETKAEAMRMAAKSVDKFMRCVVEQVVEADPDAVKGVQWLMNNREV